MTARLTWLLVALATFLATPSYAYTDQGGFGVGLENRVWANFSEPGPSSSDFRLQLGGMLQTTELASTATASGVGLLFQAHLYDYENGLYLMRARVYDPRTGSFLQGDPEGFVDSVNPYAGMAWDPINMRDPTGRETEWVWRDGKLTLKTKILLIPRGKVRSKTNAKDKRRVAQVMKDNIEKTWTQRKSFKNRAGRRVKVEVEVDVEFVASLDEAKTRADKMDGKEGSGVRPEIFVISEKIPGRKSYTCSRGVGFVTTNDDENDSFAHEYGHLLGPSDDYYDEKWKEEQRKLPTKRSESGIVGI